MTSGFIKRLIDDYARPIRRALRPTRHASFGGIDISYRPELDGGGTHFGQDFLPYFKARGLPKQKRVYEWCSGPAFIGFSMLGNGFCESLFLADVNPRAVACCRNTIGTNNLGDRVTVCESDNLRNIPATERWNLVVSNPPHFIDEQFEGQLLAHDPEWRIHREFFASVGKFLADDGVIVLQENNAGSTVESFRRMIEDSGLKIVFVDGDSPTLTRKSAFYYIGIMRRGDAPPAWAMTRVERVRAGQAWTWQRAV
ncbi:methyltransferase [Bradyrhizobium sp.]|uniref:methyltransferase n=1 Tax=Bradyrhizobium sp. TaxID=376 RepID=UPI002398D713|nr:methyltransferase [Bradyrhizobium sp.]MDE2376686.1 methyltransferase [Bradyrhizobium sp.]